MKYFFIFSFLFIAYLSFANDCESTFSRVSVNKQLKSIGKNRLLSTYKGQEGYFRLVEKVSTKSDHDYSMHSIFQEARQFLGTADFKKLAWQEYRGTLKSALELKSEILDEKGEVKQTYYGLQGYIKIAREYFSADMHKTYRNVSAVLDKTLFKKLKWQVFQGLIEEALELRSRILDEKGKQINREYYSMKGYIKFADDYFESNLSKTYMNTSAVLNDALFKKLNWKKYDGSVEEVLDLRSKILDENGEIKKDYYDMEGYIKFAEEHFSDDLSKAFKDVSAVLGGYHNMKGLNWVFFYGTVEQYRSLYELFRNTPIENLKNEKGLEFIADQIFQGNKTKAYKNVSVLREMLPMYIEFQALRWIDPHSRKK